MHGHQPHRIQPLRGGGDLAQVAVLAVPDQPAYAVEQPPHREPLAGGLYADEVHELPDRDPLRPLGGVAAGRDRGGGPRPVEQERREHVPRLGRLVEAAQRGSQCGHGRSPLGGHPLDGVPAEPAVRDTVERAEVAQRRRQVGHRHREPGHAGRADQSHRPGIDEQGCQRGEVLDLGPFEEAAEEQHRDAQTLEVAGDLGKPLVARAEHGLIAPRVPGGAHLADAVGERSRLPVSGRHGAQLGEVPARPPVGPEPGVADGHRHPGREPGEGIDHLRDRTIVAIQASPHAGLEVPGIEHRHVER